MLWRKTKISFSAKSGRGHPLQSDLEDGGTEEADPAAVPVDLICPDPSNERTELSSERANIFNLVLRGLAAPTAKFWEKNAERVFFRVFFP